jgi:putative DNA primase/helicase
MGPCDLFPGSRKSKTEVSVYPYLDENGVKLYEKVRFEPKDFRLRINSTTWGIGKARRVLYHLPDIISAIASSSPIWIVEGEKDADNLAVLGFHSTCNCEGAGAGEGKKWRSEYTESLLGASQVYVVADKDKVGRVHAKSIVRKLTDSGIPATYLELPDRLGVKVKDASDWIQAGGTREELEQLAKSSVKLFPDVASSPSAAASSYKRLGDDFQLKTVIPFLDERFVSLLRPEGTLWTYSANDRNEVVKQLADEGLDDAIHGFLLETVGSPPPRLFASRSAALWRRQGRRMDAEPAPFLFDDAPKEKLCLKRFDWQPTPGPHPAWDEFLQRLSDADAFKAFVWSLFETRSVSRQYCWLRGEGQDGKSIVLKVLTRVFGAAAHGIDGSALRETRFLNSAIYGKRLIIYPDCKKSTFGMSELVRNWTSGDPVQIESKGEKPFTAEMRCRLIVASNCVPEFTGQDADVSRVLYVEVSKSHTTDDGGWCARLESELPAFLDDCRSTYSRLCPTHGNIPLNDKGELLRETAKEEFEEPIRTAFERAFYLEPSSSITGGEFRDALRSVGVCDDHEVRDLKRWLEREHGIVQERTLAGRFYNGIGVKR